MYHMHQVFVQQDHQHDKVMDQYSFPRLELKISCSISLIKSHILLYLSVRQVQQKLVDFVRHKVKLFSNESVDIVVHHLYLYKLIQVEFLSLDQPKYQHEFHCLIEIE